MNKNTKKNYDAEATFIVSECQMRLRRSRRVTFLLTNGFDFFSYSAALETLRLANRAADRVLFSYIFISESNGAVTSSIDHPMKVDSGLIELHRDDLLILCTGDRINNDTDDLFGFRSPALSSSLQRYLQLVIFAPSLA